MRLLFLIFIFSTNALAFSPAHLSELAGPAAKGSREALQKIEFAANEGDAEAQNLMGEALGWLQRAAGRGHAPAMEYVRRIQDRLADRLAK